MTITTNTEYINKPYFAKASQVLWKITPKDGSTVCQDVFISPEGATTYLEDNFTSGEFILQPVRLIDDTK